MANFISINSTQSNPGFLLQGASIDFFPTLLANGLQVITGAQQVIQVLLASLTTVRGSIYRARTIGTTVVTSLFEQLDDTTLTELVQTLTNDLTNSVPGVAFSIANVNMDITNKIMTFTINLTINNQMYTVTQNINLTTMQVF